jgi:hypothetical protein
LLGLGEWWLRRAIRETVTVAGNEDLRTQPTVRRMVRRMREMEE